MSPLEKVIFDNFFKCNHLIIKWHFVGKRTKNYFLKWTHKLNFRKYAPHALKGQKLLAQGNALGVMAGNKAPCKGKSLINCLEF